LRVIAGTQPVPISARAAARVFSAPGRSAATRSAGAPKFSDWPAGMVGSLLTSVAGSSDVLLGGFVTYANEMKTALVGVPREMIEARGAVSEDVALAMARGGLERTSGATDALAITGVAGPGGGSVAKPVGTVFVARASREGTREVSCECRRLLITGGREDVRGRASRLALAMLRWHVLGETVPTVLWQVRGA